MPDSTPKAIYFLGRYINWAQSPDVTYYGPFTRRQLVSEYKTWARTGDVLFVAIERNGTYETIDWEDVK